MGWKSYTKTGPESSVRSMWTDENGKRWVVPTQGKELSFYKRAPHAALRAFVCRRAEFKCEFCGLKADNVPADYDGRRALRAATPWKKSWGTTYFDIDHVIPRSRGGTSRPSNLRMLCQSCNCSKGARHICGVRINLLREKPAGIP